MPINTLFTRPQHKPELTTNVRKFSNEYCWTENPSALRISKCDTFNSHN